MSKKDVGSRTDIEQIVIRFYDDVLEDPIIGFIFSDIAKIDLETHLPVIVDFWSDVVLRQNRLALQDQPERRYTGNVLAKHLHLNELIALKPGHFTRWLYLFEKAIHEQFQGPNSNLMMKRAVIVAQSISAAIVDRKRAEMNLTLPD